MSFLRMNELDLTNERVLIREDLNVPLADGEVSTTPASGRRCPP